MKKYQTLEEEFKYRVIWRSDISDSSIAHYVESLKQAKIRYKKEKNKNKEGNILIEKYYKNIDMWLPINKKLKLKILKEKLNNIDKQRKRIIKKLNEINNLDYLIFSLIYNIENKRRQNEKI